MTFADMTVDQQRAYQVKEAQDIVNRLAAGDAVTQSEIDFANRILGKNYGSIAPSGFSNIAAGLDDLTNAVSSGSWKVFLPIIALLIVIAVVIFLWKK